MGDEKKATIPKPTSNGSKSTNLKHMEKLAVKSDIPVENLIDEFLKQSLAPNPNDGNNYYIGYVTQIIDEKSSIAVYDIFTDSTANLERFLLGKTEKRKDKSIKCIVAIPELYSTSYVSFKDGNLLDYATKFKINHKIGPNTKIEVGSIVKVTFKNNNNFTDPEIISISPSRLDLNFIDEKAIKETYKKFLECKIAQIGGSSANSANLSSKILGLPRAGYYQLFEELNLSLSAAGRRNFSNSIGIFNNTVIDALSKLNYTIYLDDEVKKIAATNKDLKLASKLLKSGEEGTSTSDQQPYEVFIIFKIVDSEKEKLINFLSFIEKSLTKYPFNVEQVDLDLSKTPGFFGKLLYVDVNAINFSKEGELIDPSTFLKKYLENSEKLKNGGIIAEDGTSIPVAQVQSVTIEQNENFISCENPESTAPKTYYIDINEAAYSKERKKQDYPYISYFLLNQTSGSTLQKRFLSDIKEPSDIIKNPNLRVIGEYKKNPSKLPYLSFEDLQKINPKFYGQRENLIPRKDGILPTINSNYSIPEQNFIAEDALYKRLNIIENFLLSLKSRIASNENVKPQDILILPLNTIRIREKNVKGYTSSRHFFGQAVDFVVYVRIFSPDGKIHVVQMPPEVVFLYCNKESKSTDEYLFGHGLFFKEMYNHFEFLYLTIDEEKIQDFADTKELTDDEKENGRIWLSDPPKGLDKLSNETTKKIGNAIFKYVIDASKKLDPLEIQKFRRLG